jgi:hypothetical protein
LTRLRTEPTVGQVYIVRWAGGHGEADEATFRDEPEADEESMSVVLQRLGAELIGTSHRGNQKWRFASASGPNGERRSRRRA